MRIVPSWSYVSNTAVKDASLFHIRQPFHSHFQRSRSGTVSPIQTQYPSPWLGSEIFKPTFSWLSSSRRQKAKIFQIPLPNFMKQACLHALRNMTQKASSAPLSIDSNEYNFASVSGTLLSNFIPQIQSVHQRLITALNKLRERYCKNVTFREITGISLEVESLCDFENIMLLMEAVRFMRLFYKRIATLLLGCWDLMCLCYWKKAIHVLGHSGVYLIFLLENIRRKVRLSS